MIPFVVPYIDGRAYYFDEIYTGRYIPEIVEELLVATKGRWNY